MTTTSFAGLRNQSIEHIEIPIIQRDYAQGREDPTTKRIRGAFIEALLRALEINAEAMALDFIYGEQEGNKLIPLDGQQRLTTLFLLHWYLAARLSLKPGVNGCCNLPTLTYLTRTSSADFCRKLADDCCPPFTQLRASNDATDKLGDWISDQSWFRKAWERDPTIVGMLVTLNDLHSRMTAWDMTRLLDAWRRLTDIENPAISFDLLRIADIGPADDQYIRMNARGKPLTEFEHFKARFEKTLSALPTEQSGQVMSARKRFAEGVDGNWTDLLWPLRNSGENSDRDNVIDDEFLRLFRYLGALVVWKFNLRDTKAVPDKTEELEAWAESLYGLSDSQGERRAFLFDALDALFCTFKGKDRPAIEAEFEQWLSGDTHQPGKVAIFKKSPYLLIECVTHYGESTQNDRFPLAHQLIFYGLLHGWMAKSPLNAQRLRVLRNLLLAPDANLEQKKVADNYLPGVKYLIDQGLPGVGSPMPAELSKAFSTRQLSEEVAKDALKSGNPVVAASIEGLEDHPLLQGCLFAFDLSFFNKQYVDTFYDIFPPDNLLRFAHLLTGALLTKGDYSLQWEDRFQFGSATQHSHWRDMLTRPRIDPLTIQTPLVSLLSDVAARAGEISTRLQGCIDEWLKAQNSFNWRYYFIKNESIREYGHRS